MTSIRTSGVVFDGYSLEEGLGISVSAKTLDQVKAGAIDEGNIIKRIWNAVREFFSPSDHGEGKRALISFYSEGSTDQEKIESFYRLKELAGFRHGDFLQPEVNYHAKPEGGFYKTYHLKMKIDGLENSIERLIERDCVEAEEILKAYSSCISTNEDKELFEHCINTLYPSAKSSNLERGLAVQGAIVGLYGIVLRNPEVEIVVDLFRDSVEYKGEKFPPHGVTRIYDPALRELGVDAAVKERLNALLDPHLPAAISINQKDEAIDLFHQIMVSDGDLRETPEIDHVSMQQSRDAQDEERLSHREGSMLRSAEEEWDGLFSRTVSYFSPELFGTDTSIRELLGVVYSHRASIEDKNDALLRLSLQLNDSDRVKFEISEFEPGPVDGFSPKIVKVRMSFPGSDQLDCVEIAKVEFNNPRSKGDMKLGGEPQYVPWAGGWSSNSFSYDRALSEPSPAFAPTTPPIRPMGIFPLIKS